MNKAAFDAKVNLIKTIINATITKMKTTLQLCPKIQQ
jgi:hypothetical protein